ncbi:MAG TPA: creatininase family protein [Chloroflexi bacterium]|nr:creatininase family protein [Chloroflexota bacterium]
MKLYLAEFRPSELRAYLAKYPLALVPIGTIEWHADHLPLGVDGLLSRSICEELARETGCVIAPPIWYGVCRDLSPEDGYYGTIATISEKTLESLIADVLNGLAGLGFRAALLFSGHFETEHFDAIQRGIEQARGIEAYFLTEVHLLEDKVQTGEDVEETWHFAGDHAAEFETSLMQHYHPDLVEMSQAPETIELTMEGLPPYLHRRYPRRASAAYGAQLREEILRAGTKKIRDLMAQLQA